MAQVLLTPDCTWAADWITDDRYQVSQHNPYHYQGTGTSLFV